MWNVFFWIEVFGTRNCTATLHFTFEGFLAKARKYDYPKPSQLCSI
jgi:hypothetical protein